MFVHEVGIELVIFIVGVVCGMPGFWQGWWKVVRNACRMGTDHAQGSMVKWIRTIFLVEFTNDVITVDERWGGGGGLVHTSKFAVVMALKIVVCIGMC